MNNTAIIMLVLAIVLWIFGAFTTAMEKSGQKISTGLQAIFYYFGMLIAAGTAMYFHMDNSPNILVWIFTGLALIFFANSVANIIYTGMNNDRS